MEDELQVQQEFLVGEITDVANTEVSDTQLQQDLTITIDRGSEKGKVIESTYFDNSTGENQRTYAEGDTVVMVHSQGPAGEQYYVSDYYRLPMLGALLVVFMILILLFTRKRGVYAFFGLGFTVLMLTQYIVPNIARGANPLMVSFFGALGIALLSLYMAHGFNKRTTIALMSTVVIIVAALGIAYLFVDLAQLNGLGSEDAYFVQSTPFGSINVRGLLLGSMIIGLLGVLDDVTTAQAATVDELKKANPSLSMKELYARGMSVGREHITSLVNTLVLAYAGASMPLLLFFSFDFQPFWVSLNSEFVAEEVVRTLVGSVVLVLGVPFTTLVAAYFFSQRWFLTFKTTSDR